MSLGMTIATNRRKNDTPRDGQSFFVFLIISDVQCQTFFVTNTLNIYKVFELWFRSDDHSGKVIAVEVQSFGDGKGLTIRMSERVIIRKEFFNITLEERDVSYKVIIQDIR
ncbi:MAG: hypothetical protein J0G32_07945, partial [Alphaproteobacteria bacterium]|nr:hypothetical protein [Alphaproteobacteria bacterium]